MKTEALLKGFHLFHGADPDDLAAVAALTQRKRYGPSELVYRQGAKAQALYLVELGTVEIIEAGNPATVLARISSGGECGVFAFFHRDKRVASARACESSYILSLPFTALARALERRPQFSLIFHRNACSFLSAQLRATVTDLAFAWELNRQHF
jgi:CRP-like cAMP-binding protein